MNTEVTNKNMSIRSVLELIDLYKERRVSGEKTEVIVTPFFEDGIEKRQVTIGLQGGFSRDRDTLIFEDSKEFDEIILPVLMAYISQEDKFGPWGITVAPKEGTTNKGVMETESGNLFYLETMNSEDFELSISRMEEEREKTEYKKEELDDTDKTWDGILTYVRNRNNFIDYTGYSLDTQEIEELYNLIESIATKKITKDTTVIIKDKTRTKENLEKLLSDRELLSQFGFTPEFIDKLLKNVSTEVLASLVINERKFNNKFDKNDENIKPRVEFARVQLGGMKSNYFKSKKREEVLNNLIEEYKNSLVYTDEEKEEYIKYCNELLEFIKKVKNNKNKIVKNEVDLDAPRNVRNLKQDNSIVDDYQALYETIDLMKYGRVEEERYEMIVEKDPQDKSKRLVRISLLDGVSRNDTYNFVFTDGQKFDGELRGIIDRVYSDDPNFMTEVEYVNVPGEETKKNSLRITRDNNELLIKDTPEGLEFEKTKLVEKEEDKTLESSSESKVVEVEKEEQNEEFIMNIILKTNLAVVFKNYRQLLEKYNGIEVIIQKMHDNEMQDNDKSMFMTISTIQNSYSYEYERLYKKDNLSNIEKEAKGKIENALYRFGLIESELMFNEELESQIASLQKEVEENKDTNPVNKVRLSALQYEQRQREEKAKEAVEVSRLAKEEANNLIEKDVPVIGSKNQAVNIIKGELDKAIEKNAFSDINQVCSFYGKLLRKYNGEEGFKKAQEKGKTSFEENLSYKRIKDYKDDCAKEYNLIIRYKNRSMINLSKAVNKGKDYSELLYVELGFLSDEKIDEYIKGYELLDSEVKKNFPIVELDYIAYTNEKKDRLKNKKYNEENIEKGSIEQASIFNEIDKARLGGIEEAKLLNEKNIIKNGAIDEAKMIDDVDKNRVGFNNFLNNIMGEISKKEGLDKVETKQATFEQLHEYVKKYKISNTNGPIEIFDKVTNEKYEPKDEQEKRDIEFAYYWGVMVGKNNKDSVGVVDLEYAYSDEMKKLFDIMDVHIKESLQRGIDIDFDSLEEQFKSSDVPNAEEIFDSLFKNEALNDYVTKYYKDSLGIKEDTKKEDNKEESKEYAEYRKLFDTKLRAGLSQNGQMRLNSLREKSGAIGAVEKANQDVYKALFDLVDGKNDEEFYNKYEKTQEIYNNEKKKYDDLYEDAIREFEVPEDYVTKEGIEVDFYDQIRKINENPNKEILLSPVGKGMVEYLLLSATRDTRQLTEREEKRLTSLVRENSEVRVLEYARASLTVGAITQNDYFEVLLYSKEKLNKEIENAKVVNKPFTPNVQRTVNELPTEAVQQGPIYPQQVVPQVPVVKEPVKQEAPVSEEKDANLNLSKDDRDFANYIKLVTVERHRKQLDSKSQGLTPEEREKLNQLVATNERAAILEDAKKKVAAGELSKDSFDNMYVAYREQLRVAINNACLEKLVKKTQDAPVLVERKEEEIVVPKELINSYNRVKSFEESSLIYSVEKSENGYTIFDKKTNLEVNPENINTSLVLFANHWMNSVGVDRLYDNALLYGVLKNEVEGCSQKGEEVNLDALREKFIATGVENADVCFDNLFSDDKKEFVVEHLSNIENIEKPKKENNEIIEYFSNMRDLVSKYYTNEEHDVFERDNNMLITLPQNDKHELIVGERFEKAFGNHEDGIELDLTVFEKPSLLERLKDVLIKVKDAIVEAGKVFIENIKEAFSGNLESATFVDRLLPNDSALEDLEYYVSDLVGVQKAEIVDEFAKKVSEAETKQVVPNTIIASPEMVKIDENVVEEEKSIPTPEVKEEVPVEDTKVQAPVGNEDSIVDGLSEFLDLAFTECREKDRQICLSVFFGKENPNEGELNVLVGNDENVFQQKFSSDQMKTTVLPLIIQKYVENNDGITKQPMYQPYERKRNELIYVGSQTENVFEVCNASPEMLQFAESLMGNELRNRKEEEFNRQMRM